MKTRIFTTKITFRDKDGSRTTKNFIYKTNTRAKAEIRAFDMLRDKFPPQEYPLLDYNTSW